MSVAVKLIGNGVLQPAKASHKGVSALRLVDVRAQPCRSIWIETLCEQPPICIEQVLCFKLDGFDQEGEAGWMGHSGMPDSNAAA